MSYRLKQTEFYLFNPISCGFAIIVIALLSPPLLAVDKDIDTGVSAIDLVSITSSVFDELYINPKADFGKYQTVLIEDAPISFVSTWVRDHRDELSRRDVERIKKDTAEMLKRELTAKLSENDGYKVVTEVADDTLLIKPEIIEMNLFAPATSSRATLVPSAGHATLSLEIYDARSNERLAKIIDYRMADGLAGQDFYRATRTSNAHEFGQIMSVWGNRIRNQLGIMQN